MKTWFAYIPKLKKILVFILVSLFLLFLLYLCYQSWLYWTSMEGVENAKDRFMVRNDFIKTVAQVLGAGFFLFGLYFTWKNLILNQEKNRSDSFFAQEKQTTNLFTKAIEQLGSDKIEVRLGGIYALERIARDSERDHWAIMEVLSAYLREHSPWKEGQSPDNESILSNLLIRPYNEMVKDNYFLRMPKISHDIQAILTVLGRRNRTYLKGEDHHLDLNGVDLRGANLKGANLEGALLMGSHLDYADLTEANLRIAILYGSFLTNTDFSRANLEGCALVQVNLSGASLAQAQLKAAHLTNSNLTRANLNRANMEGAWLENTSLLGADLTGVLGLTMDQIKMAIINDETKLPDYLNIPGES
jgi:hypothetical protein